MFIFAASPFRTQNRNCHKAHTVGEASKSSKLNYLPLTSSMAPMEYADLACVSSSRAMVWLGGSELAWCSGVVGRSGDVVKIRGTLIWGSL